MDQICLDPPGQVTSHPPHPSDTLSTKHPPPTGQKSACGPAPEDNFWNSPNVNRMGDEVHVLLECPNRVIVQLRKIYLPKCYQSRPSVFKFVSLMESLSGNITSARKVNLLWQRISKLV